MNRYSLEVRDSGFFRFRVIYHLGYISKAGTDSIVCGRFRTREKAERYLAKMNSRTWRSA